MKVMFPFFFNNSFNFLVSKQDSVNVPSKRSSPVSDSTAAVGSSLTANSVPLDIKKITKSSALTAAVENASLQTRNSFDQLMQQNFFSEEMELCLHWEEQEELRREHEEECHERDEERRQRNEERYVDRCCREEELLELRRKESQQQQQMTMMMQLGMTAMMAYLGAKPPKPDDK
jgi:hypothetical protein